MKTLLNIIFLAASMTIAHAQSISVTTELHKDTVGYEEGIRVTFKIEGVQDFEFTAPSFNDFAEATKTGTSNSMTIINGEMKQSISYTYILQHLGKGVYAIEPAIIEVNGEVYQSDIVEVVVVDEPRTPDKKSEMDRMMEQFGRSPFDFDRNDLFKNFPQMPELGFPKDMIPQPLPRGEEGNPNDKKKKKKKVYKL